MSNNNTGQTVKQYRTPALNFTEMGIPKDAKNADLDYIVTENLKDFKHSQVKAISIESALEKISVK